VPPKSAKRFLSCFLSNANVCGENGKKRLSGRAARPWELAQPGCGTALASDHSPSGPALRANPCPEVTDLSCRLPLPTLFYRLEAVHLGDLLRIWVRSGAEIIVSPSDFQGPTRDHRTPQEPRCFTGTVVHISGRTDSMDSVPYKEKKTLPGSPADVSEFVCALPLRPREGRSPHPGSGILT